MAQSTTQIDQHQPSVLISLAHLARELSPLFPLLAVHFYYHFTYATLTPSDTFVHIPFKALNTFNAFNIIPSPININGSLHSISLQDSLTIVSDDFQLIALPGSVFLTTCDSSLHHLHLWLAAEFSILPTLPNPSVTALSRNSTPHSSCHHVKL